MISIAECLSQRKRNTVLTDIARLKIFVIYFETCILYDKEKEALENLSKGKICYFVGSAGNNIVNNKHVHKIIPWDFQLPNPAFLSAIMNNEDVRLEEIAYISDNLLFLNNARELMGYTIYIAPKGIPEYKAIAGTCPDMICSSLSRLLACFSEEIIGFKGESSFYCNSAISPGIFYRVAYETRNSPFEICFAGRYFGTKHFLGSIDRYSQAIRDNKTEKSKCYRKFDSKFKNLYFQIISSYQKQFGICISSIANVPDKPSKKPRFSEITNLLSLELGMRNISSDFICQKDIKDNKSLSSADRQKNIAGSFSYNGPSLKGQTIAIIDDIATTGSTLSACVDELLRNGADRIICFVLAINQFPCNFCKQESFDTFKQEYHLHFNSSDLTPFFSSKKGTLNYDKTIEILLNNINSYPINHEIATDLENIPF